MLKKVGIIIFLSLVILATGCSAYKDIDDHASQGSIHSENLLITDRYKIEFDCVDQTIVVIDVESNVSFSLIRDVFPTKDTIWKIAVYEETCYVLLTENNKIGFKIRSIDLDDFSTTIEYSNIPAETESIFEAFVMDEKGTLLKLMELMKGYYGLFVNEHNIYIVDGSKNIQRIHRDTFVMETIVRDAMYPDSVSLFEDDLYYTNSFRHLSKYDSTTNEIMLVGEVYTTDYKIIDRKVFYKDEMNDNKEECYSIGDI